MKLSIVIPIYKAEKWISRSLDSIFNQGADMSKFEVICVVDGSPDNSSAIVKGYQRKYSNVILLEQMNSGVSVARNHGIECAKGDYITFLDSDDILIEGALQLLITTIDSSSYDIIVCRSFINKREWPCWVHFFSDGDVSSPEQAVKKGFLRGSVWGCCYKRDLIENNKIIFPIGVSNGEDNFFFISCLYFSRTLLFKDIKLYKVIEEEDSLSRSFSRQRIDGVINSLKIMRDQMSLYPERKNTKFVLQYINYTCLSGLVNSTLETKNVGLCYLLKAKINNFTNFDINSDIVFLRSKMKLMKFSFSFFYFLSYFKYKVLNRR